MMRHPSYRRRPALRPRIERLEDRLELALVATGAAEFHVNTTTTGDQQSPAIAVDSNGDFVVAWQSGDFTNGYQIRAQRYNAAGVAQGGEITVDSSAENANEYRFNPSVAMDSAGDFVVTWEYYDLSGVNTTGYDIFARRFNAAGVAQGNEFRVNSTVASDQQNSSVAMDSAGDFVVAWRSGDASPVVDFQQYNASGVAQGGQTAVDLSATNTQSLPSVAMDSAGDFVIAWDGNSSSLGDASAGVFFQRYNSARTPQGSTTRANTTTAGTQSNPSVAMDATGNFDVAWAGNGTGDSQGIFFQRYNSSGIVQGSETRANTTTGGGQTIPRASISSADYLAIVWSDDTNDGNGQGVFGQQFDPSGNPLGGSFRVNTTTTGDQTNPAVATAPGGNTVVAWQSKQESNATTGIYGQQYNINFPPTDNAQTVNVVENTAKAITLTASDPESDPLTYTVTANPSHGTLTGTAPNLTYTPNPNFTGSDSFQFKTNDGHQDGTVATVTINVAGPPTANPQSVTAVANTATAISLTASDPNTPPKTLTYSIVSGPANGSISNFNASTGQLTYTSNAAFAGTDSFTFKVNNGVVDSNTATVTINVLATVSSTVTVNWGTAGTATLQTNGDGLRLLPAGRSTDLPWLNISKVQITLNHAETLNPSDVSVTGVNLASYGPVMLSGSGTSYTITLSQVIAGPDRVTVTIGNASIATFTRRLDVLPGDFNDDGVVTIQDAVLIRNEYLGVGGAVPTIFGDIDGDGVVDINDYNQVRRRLGIQLP